MKVDGMLKNLFHENRVCGSVKRIKDAVCCGVTFVIAVNTAYIYLVVFDIKTFRKYIFIIEHIFITYFFLVNVVTSLTAHVYFSVGNGKITNYTNSRMNEFFSVYPVTVCVFAFRQPVIITGKISRYINFIVRFNNPACKIPVGPGKFAARAVDPVTVMVISNAGNVYFTAVYGNSPHRKMSVISETGKSVTDAVRPVTGNFFIFFQVVTCGVNYAFDCGDTLDRFAFKFMALTVYPVARFRLPAVNKRTAHVDNRFRIGTAGTGQKSNNNKNYGNKKLFHKYPPLYGYRNYNGFKEKKTWA